MATIRSYTTIEQSRKLAEILPLESADMSFLSEESLVPKVICYGMVFFNIEEERPSTIIPCWSLAALLGVLPKGTNVSISDSLDKIRYSCWNDYTITYASNPVDACVAMVEKLHELNLL